MQHRPFDVQSKTRGNLLIDRNAPAHTLSMRHTNPATDCVILRFEKPPSLPERTAKTLKNPRTGKIVLTASDAERLQPTIVRVERVCDCAYAAGQTGKSVGGESGEQRMMKPANCRIFRRAVDCTTPLSQDAGCWKPPGMADDGLRYLESSAVSGSLRGTLLQDKSACAGCMNMVSVWRDVMLAPARKNTTVNCLVRGLNPCRTRVWFEKPHINIHLGTGRHS